jgi:menaquinone-dependent protoporphyrinogen oxidase
VKTLIAYATKHGATRQYAEQLAGQLPGETTLVDLKKDPGVDVSVFDTVIVGGAVYFGQVQKEVRDFCVRNLALLRNKRLGLFICCLFDGQQAERQLQTAFPGELLEAALVKDAFGGRVNPAELTFAERLVTRVVARGTGMPEKCSRYSEDAIRRFARVLKVNTHSER